MATGGKGHLQQWSQNPNKRFPEFSAWQTKQGNGAGGQGGEGLINPQLEKNTVSFNKISLY